MLATLILSSLASGLLTVAPAPPAAAAAAPHTGVVLRQASVATVTDTSTDFVRHPQLRIVAPMAPWQAIEAQDDAFDFSQLDLDVQHAAADDYLLLVRIMSGRLSPDWLAGAGVQTLRLLGTDDNAHDYCDWIDAPLPWDPVLAQEYREMMAAFGAWTSAPDGLGGTNADHVYVVPISMPAILGSEMQIGNGASVTCPAGTDGAGQNLAGVNSAAWNTVGTTTQRRAWVAQAWRDAIDVHMDELPTDVRSIIAWGGIFADGHAAALDLAQTEIGPHRARLWSMFTNLQPLSSGNQITGVWKDWCPACHDVIMAALGAGGTVGFQVAGTDRMDTGAEFHAAVDDALARYTPRFIEGSAAAIDREAAYLLTDPDPVQDRLAAIAAQVLSTSSVGCSSAAVGDPATCTVTVSELWDDPDLVAGGEVTWSSVAGPTPATCVLDVSGSCSVTVTPSSPGGTPVTASYAGDAAHRPSDATGNVQTTKRPVTVGTSCQTPVATGNAATCTVTVADAGDSTPAGSVTWTAAGAGALGAGTCTLSGTAGTASCAVTFTPSAAGTSLVTATYAGSAQHDGGAATASVVGTRRSTSVSVTCPGAAVKVGSAATCTATVADASGGGGSAAPTGTVSWSAAGAGTLGASSCTLVAAGGGTASCGVTFTPSAAGTTSITGTYAGTGQHEGGTASSSVTAALRTTSVAVTCPTGTVNVGSPATCTATVTDTSGAGVPPTGVVSWSSASVGTFAGGTTCTLAGTGATRSCTIAYTPSMAGTHVVQAAYSGDVAHAGTQASGSLVAVVADTTPPTVRITSPANNANVPKGKTLTITATATDAGGVTRVEFRVGATLTCTDTTAPYACAWAVPKVANVVYTLTATGRDTAGNTATATITVRAR